MNNSLFEEPILEGVVPPPPPEPLPGALSQDRIAAVRELSMKPAPTRVDVAVSCNLLGDVITPISAHNHHHRRRRRQPLLTSSSSPHAQPISTLLATPTAMGEGEIEGMPQSFVEGASGQGLLGRWFMSTLGSWRRTGSGVDDDDAGSRRDYEQPEVSEATVVSSMQEEVEDEYASITSRHESVDGGYDEAEGVAGNFQDDEFASLPPIVSINLPPRCLIFSRSIEWSQSNASCLVARCRSWWISTINTYSVEGGGGYFFVFFCSYSHGMPPLSV